MQQAFDKVAQAYDASFTYSVIGTAQRNVVWSYLENSSPLNEKLNIIELNCGTGEDALWFAKKGHKVLATDISEKMLEISKEKLNEAGLSSSVRTMRVDINKLENAGINEKFDLVFSNFGGMNCIPLKEMKTQSLTIKKLLSPGGLLIMVIMPKFCLWETIYFLLKFNFRKAFRRRSGNGTIAKFKGTEFRTYYFSPGRIKKLFEPDFKVIAVQPIGFFIPPSYLESLFSNRPKFFNVLKKLEYAFHGFSFLAGSSDHYLIDLRVK